MVYLAGVDASIARWFHKYDKLFWRPETAINNAATDGNPNTDPLDAGAYWKPYLFPSHPHPEYPSVYSRFPLLTPRRGIFQILCHS